MWMMVHNISMALPTHTNKITFKNRYYNETFKTKTKLLGPTVFLVHTPKLEKARLCGTKNVSLPPDSVPTCTKVEESLTKVSNLTISL